MSWLSSYSSSPTISELNDVAKAAITVFKKHDLQTCVVGSLACYHYGMNRTPADVDLIVMSRSYSQEQLKEMLVREDPRFYTVRAKNWPRDTFNVLWFRISTSNTSYSVSKTCKIDILQPGVMNIPSVPSQLFVQTAGLPLMPFLPLLLLKLQAWEDHGNSSKPHLQRKQTTDVTDLISLTDLIKQRRFEKEELKAKGDWTWTGTVLLSESVGRIARFKSTYSTTENAWKQIVL
ncbi:hypothetical protein BDN72DRAFT_846874 [Pluteus cervinus]|uniref:Uncharacterized protein n=1 Tax=Pluteus cervinus TaxID=181527 RepID=A0ACD3AEU0_9AGAR|nr:hypothetical protein BDN72DRAFT_846874 [Pluteus cervinus]